MVRGSRFDWDYYLGKHLELANELLRPLGLLRIEIDHGVSGLPPGAAPPYHAIGHLFFRTKQEADKALAATAEAFIADQRKYFDQPSVVQISKVVEF